MSHSFALFVLSTVASGLNALAAVTVEDFSPLVVQHIPTEREALVSKLLGNTVLGLQIHEHTGIACIACL